MEMPPLHTGCDEADSDTALTRRKGEIAIGDLDRKWPYHAALLAEKVRAVNREVVFCAAGVLSATPLTYSLRRDDKNFVVLCFSKSKDVEAFAKRFGGELFRADCWGSSPPGQGMQATRT
jgi:hypothetical protein